MLINENDRPLGSVTSVRPGTLTDTKHFESGRLMRSREAFSDQRRESKLVPLGGRLFFSEWVKLDGERLTLKISGWPPSPWGGSAPRSSGRFADTHAVAYWAEVAAHWLKRTIRWLGVDGP
jgi:hypothetical protein